MARVHPSSHAHSPPPQPTTLDAKLVILGAQGVGKTSLVQRYLNPHVPLPSNVQSTIGASFVTKRIIDHDSSTIVRLQIWDTAGQERFRSISRLYYRGAHAGLLCYDVTDQKSWEEMKGWLKEVKQNCFDGEEEPIIHIVGTKTDLVERDSTRREVPFEKTITYVAEQKAGMSQASTPPLTMKASGVQNPGLKRSSGFWNSDVAWDTCHEVSAQDGEGIEEVFRVIARKLIEQRNRREARLALQGQTPGIRSENEDDYFGSTHNGSFRLGHGDKRKSWLGLPSVSLGIGDSEGGGGATFTRDPEEARRRGRCC